MTMLTPEVIVTAVPGTDGTPRIVMLAPEPMFDGLETP
jgi:hypothetical protein